MTLAEVVLQTLLLFGTSLVTFIFTKRKYNAESRGVEIKNIDDSLKVYQSIISDLETRLQKLQSTVADLEVYIIKLKEENKGLKEKLTRVCRYPEAPKCD